MHTEEHTKYYITEHGQIFKFDKTEFVSYEIDLKKILWLNNRKLELMYFIE